MKDSYEQRIQNQFGAFCVKVLKNEALHIQRDYAGLRDQEKSFGELTTSELEQTAVWDKHFMREHVFEVLGLPVIVTGDLLADALAQLPEGKRDVILLSYFLEMTDREISEKLKIKNAANQRKMACSGVFGVPDTTRTCDPGLRSMACRFVHRPLHNLPYCLI